MEKRSIGWSKENIVGDTARAPRPAAEQQGSKWAALLRGPLKRNCYRNRSGRQSRSLDNVSRELPLWKWIPALYARPVYIIIALPTTWTEGGAGRPSQLITLSTGLANFIAYPPRDIYLFLDNGGNNGANNNDNNSRERERERRSTCSLFSFRFSLPLFFERFVVAVSRNGGTEEGGEKHVEDDRRNVDLLRRGEKRGRGTWLGYDAPLNSGKRGNCEKNERRDG